jgi:DNA phosphorothioation-dependent restriction protein DptG
VKSLWFSTLKQACLNCMYVSNLDLDLRKVDQKYLEGFGMLCWRKMKICWTDRVKNEEVIRVLKEGINILHTVQRRKVNWTGHILPRSCLLNHVIEDEEENTSSYWMILRKREDAVNLKTKHYIALCGELALEETMDLSYDRLQDEWK